MNVSEQVVLAARSAVERLRRSGDEPGARAVETLLRAVERPSVPGLEYYTAPEAGDRLGVTGQTIKNWVSKGQLSGYRLGNRIVIPKEAVEEYVRRAGASLDLDDLSEDEADRGVDDGRRSVI